MILHRKLCVQTNRSRDLHYIQVSALFKVQVRYTGLREMRALLGLVQGLLLLLRRLHEARLHVGRGRFGLLELGA